MSYQLRERNPETLEQMQSNFVSVQANLLAKKAWMRNEKKVVLKEEALTSNGKVDVLAKSLEIIMDKLDIMDRKDKWDNQQQQPPLRNQNFRKNPNATKNTTPNQQVRPPLQEIYVEEWRTQEEVDDTQINLLETTDEDTIFITQEE